MLYAALVLINKTPDTSPEVQVIEQENTTRSMLLFDEKAIDTGWEFTIKKILKYKNSTSAYIKFSKFAEGKSDSIGLIICPPGKKIEQCPEATLIYQDNERMLRKKIKNHFYNNNKGVSRRLSEYTMPLIPSPAMQSQLFAMLNLNSADQKWIDRYTLEDFQQNEVYSWQDANLPAENNLNPSQVVLLSNNVLRYAKLPNLMIKFEHDVNSCSFSVNSGLVVKKDTINPLPWLVNSDEETYQRIGSFEKSPKIKISDMVLSFSLDWGMTEPIVLHELSHYIAFILPTAYRLNKGKVPLTINMYTEIFSSHGSLFMAIFSFLLVRFHNVNRKSLYNSMDEDNIKYFHLDGLTLEDFEKALDKHAEELELNEESNDGDDSLEQIIDLGTEL